MVHSSSTLLEDSNQLLINMAYASDPPFHETYKTLLDLVQDPDHDHREKISSTLIIKTVDECELPMIDLGRLNSLDPTERKECKMEIARASEEWGFFQVVNHGVSTEILEKMRVEQVQLFKQPFEIKSKEDKFLNFSAGSYRWGTSSATCLKQLSWSEAFHVPLIDILGSHGKDSLSLTMGRYAATVSSLAQNLAEILAENMGHNPTFFQENCLAKTCYLRLNRYPPCSINIDEADRMFGLTPHTDSDFLTILHQDHVGGLQLVKDGKWIAVKPNPEALIINIGDLFQAWSNDVYKSVQHRVITNPQFERFSVAYFLCPSYDTIIQSYCEPSIYRQFSFREYRLQVQDDVKKYGSKVGLPRFLV